MLDDLKTAFSRTPTTLAQDIVGGAALMVILVAGLHLPGFL